MQRLLEDLRTMHLKQVYLLYGEEAYLRLQYRDRLKQALIDPKDTMNYHYYEGRETDPEELMEQAQTMPFFAQRRVIVVENSGFFKKASDRLADFIRNLPETVSFVFVETEVDKRGRLFRAVKDVGRTVEFPMQDEATLQKWVLTLLKKENKKITESTLRHFLQKTGPNMENIRRELEKVLCYTLERDVVTKEDVDAVCVRQISGQIFDMVEAIALRRQQQALKLYYDLLSKKEPPMRILSLIGRQFNLLMQVKQLKKKGYDDRSIGEQTGLPGFVIRKYTSQAARFSMHELKEALQECVEADEAVKTGKMNDVLSVELLMIRHSAATDPAQTLGRTG